MKTALWKYVIGAKNINWIIVNQMLNFVHWKSYQSIDLSRLSGNDEINFFTVFQYTAYQACKSDSIPIYLVLHHRLSINKFLNKYGLKKNTGIVVGNYYSLANNHSMKQSPRYWLNRKCQNCIICLFEKISGNVKYLFIILINVFFQGNKQNVQL